MVRMRTLSRTLAVVAISSCLLITHTPATPQAPKLDDLRKQLDSIAEGVEGKLGYSLHHLTKNESLDRLGDEMFPTDSSIKIAIVRFHHGYWSPVRAESMIILSRIWRSFIRPQAHTL